MLDPDKLYFSSESYRNLLDEIGENIHREDIAERANNLIDACKYGLEVWENLIKFMEKLEAKSIYELQEENATIYDLLYWASSFADELHSASRIDKSFETHKLNFCESYVHMHSGMLNKKVRNLGNVRISLAESYYKMGKIDKVDSLFREWLSNEPDWGWGYIGWSDLYWLWNLGNEKDFAKAESILREGLSIPDVRDHEHINDRLDNLQKENKSAQQTT